MDDPDELQAELEQLSAAYAARLPERIATLERAWEELQGDGWNSDGLQLLSRQVHNLAGSGRTFGFALLSEAARNLEDCLREIAAAGSVPDAQHRDRVRALLRELHRATLQAGA